MTVEQLVQVQRAQPFRAYRIHLADGRHLDVGHPDFLARSPSGRTAIVYKVDETFEIIDLLLVSSLEILDGKERSQKQ
ncbi:MAG: hypothetical protein KAY37_15800 [Phycisphaerae bacterium]|nr:hypothetical protein [Phycisphaerae bacterium]